CGVCDGSSRGSPCSYQSTESGVGCGHGIDRRCITAFHRENGGALLFAVCRDSGARRLRAPRILIGGDAAATATNIIAHQSLYQLGFACDLLSVASYIIVTGPKKSGRSD